MIDFLLSARLKRAAFAGAAGFASVLAIAVALPPSIAVAQEDEEEDEGPETIADKTEDFEAIDGLFPLWRDPETGEVFMEIAEDQFDKEFIAYSYTENGIVDAGHFRGNFRDQRIIKFIKRYEMIDVVEVNTAYYFDPDSALAKASEANISNAVVANLSVEAETPGEASDDESGDETPARYLIKADGLFLNENLHQVKASPNPEAGPFDFSIGEMSSGKTHFVDLRGYPENTDVIVDYVFDQPRPMAGGGAEVTDARSVTIRMQHTLLEMPQSDYTPRFDDYRVGYFFDQVTDLTSPDATPYRDLVNRWNLVKQDPDAEMSDPVEPITWWIENTTPVEYRETIRNAALAWNEAFEAAGFTNAVAVEVQPDDAEWDAGDIRYNVLRWTSSPTPPFGGYGPSFTNPRTGEILAADIMLEYVFLTNRLDYTRLFDAAALPGSHDAEVDLKGMGKNKQCALGLRLQHDLMMAQAAATSDEEVGELVRQSLYYLVLHEVGHTLGLNHNMKASILYDAETVHDKSVTNGIIAGSVMDYPALNVAPIGMEQGDYTNSRPGPYDDWAITFGYAPEIDDPAARTALLARSTEPGLAFGNDADDMRAAGGWGIDPRVMISDMSSDMVGYAKDRIDLVQSLIPSLKEKYADEGESYQEMLNAYLILTGNQNSMGAGVSRYIGGVYVERAAIGQEGATQSYTPVPEDYQKAAMQLLKEEIFAADAFEVPADLAASLQPQRRGFNFFGNTEDPKLHERVLGIQSNILDHLVSPTVLSRMTNYQVYGGEYTPAEMLLDLNDAVYGGDLTGNPNTFRQNLQVDYTKRLVGIVGNGAYDPVAQSAALGALKDVQGRVGWFAFGQSADAAAHREHVKALIRPVLDPA